jgi:hypothetical protein
VKRLDPLLGLVEDLPPRTGAASRPLSSLAAPVPSLPPAGAPFRVGPRETPAGPSRLAYGPMRPRSSVGRAYPLPPGQNDARTYGSAITPGASYYGDAA